MHTTTIIVASGTGSRFRLETPKQFLKLVGITVLEHTLDVFECHPHIDEIVVVVSAENRLLTQEIANRGGLSQAQQDRDRRCDATGELGGRHRGGVGR